MRMRIGAQFLIPFGNDSDKNNLTNGCKFIMGFAAVFRSNNRPMYFVMILLYDSFYK